MLKGLHILAKDCITKCFDYNLLECVHINFHTKAPIDITKTPVTFVDLKLLVKITVKKFSLWSNEHCHVSVNYNFAWKDL
jgi:hypothetical protein